MILSCPNCESRFVIASSALAPEGRRVKCSNCGSMWFQLPDPDELIEDLEDSVAQEAGGDTAEQSAPDVEIDDIPDAVKPRKEDDSKQLARASESHEKQPANLKAIIAIAAGIFILFAIPPFILKEKIIGAWPESIAFYNMLGMVDTSASEALIFDRITTAIEDDTLVINGQVINLTLEDTIMPTIEIALRDETGQEQIKWFIDPPQTVLRAEDVLPFETRYALNPEEIDPASISDIRIRFVLKK